MPRICDRSLTSSAASSGPVAAGAPADRAVSAVCVEGTPAQKQDIQRGQEGNFSRNCMKGRVLYALTCQFFAIMISNWRCSFGCSKWFSSSTTSTSTPTTAWCTATTAAWSSGASRRRDTNAPVSTAGDGDGGWYSNMLEYYSEHGLKIILALVLEW